MSALRPVSLRDVRGMSSGKRIRGEVGGVYLQRALHSPKHLGPRGCREIDKMIPTSKYRYQLEPMLRLAATLLWVWPTLSRVPSQASP